MDPEKTSTHSSYMYIVSAMATDDLVTKEASASGVMVLT